jgi:hypothetical protein
MARFPRKAARWFVSVAAFSILIPAALAQEIPALPPPPIAPPAGAGIEVQASGPIHEAFAQPTDVPPGPGELVPKQPPEPIPELPPDERPDDPRVQWIPGYWAWDMERRDFLWVSGVYRLPPAGRMYVPGYWAKADGGWRWVAGYWAPASQPEPNYVPEPPATLEIGPSSPGPEDGMYVPGYWYYSGDRFVWRPGYWSTFRPGRIWTPGYYIWTPQGYLFVDGYWDAELEDRGVLFAPVTFGSAYWTTPGWCYRPSFVISIGGIYDSLFCGPRGGFYFGNYYGPAFARAGYTPWFQRSYSPYFAYYQNHYFRNNPAWAANLRQTYQERLTGLAPLPPRSFTPHAVAASNRNGAPIRPFNEGNGAGKFKFVKADAASLAVQNESIQRVRSIAKERAATGKTGMVNIPNTPRPSLGPNFGANVGSQQGQSIKLPDDVKARLREFRPSTNGPNNGPPPNLPFGNAGNNNPVGNVGKSPPSKFPATTIIEGKGPNIPSPQITSPGFDRKPFGQGLIGKSPGAAEPPNVPKVPSNFGSVGKSPGTSTPSPSVPFGNAPVQTTPKVNPPVVQTPKFNPPANTNPTPKVNPPVVQTPKFNPPANTNPTPKVNPPVVQMPKFNPPANTNPTPKVNPPVVQTPKFNPPANTNPTPKVNPPVVQTPKFNPPATPTPRFTPPSNPAPRISSPPSRPSPPPSRPSGGDGRPGGGARR